MVRVREQRKKERRDAILRAADELFHERGYNATSVEDIAARAGVGVATVYNYFGTKFDLLSAQVQPAIRRIRNAVAVLFSALPDDPIEGVIELARCYELSPDWRSRDLLEPFARDYLAGARNKRNPFDDISEMRAEHFRRLFAHYKLLGQIDAGLDEDDAVFLVNGMFQLQLREIMSGAATPATGMPSLERRLRLIFSGWRLPAAAAEPRRRK